MSTALSRCCIGLRDVEHSGQSLGDQTLNQGYRMPSTQHPASSVLRRSLPVGPVGTRNKGLLGPEVARDVAQKKWHWKFEDLEKQGGEGDCAPKFLFSFKDLLSFFGN